MNRFEQRKLIRNLICLRRAIQEDVDVITERLYQYGIFDLDTKLEILNAPNSLTSNKQVQCGILINKLIRGGQEAYTSFKTVLEDLGYHKVIQMMEKSTNDRESTNNKTLLIEDKERTFVLPNPTAYSNKNTNRNKNNKNDRFDNARHKNDSTDIFQTCTVETANDIQTLNRMVTFVLNKTVVETDGDKINTNDKVKSIITEEIDSCDKICQTFNYNECHYKSQQMAH
ncbi:hypothetical protein ACF0H5_014480 [Mactra antiquata]